MNLHYYLNYCVTVFLLILYFKGGFFIKIIKSTKNEFIKEIKKLKSKNHRYEKNMFLAEGKSIAEEILNNCPERIKHIFVTEGYSFDFDINDFDCYEVTYEVMESICETKTPQGVAICVAIDEKKIDFSGKDFFVYLDNVKDPGNVGTLIRTADAVGADGVILSPECADIYNSKTVRSAMGSMFHINIICENSYLEILKELKSLNFVISAGDLEGTENIFTTDLGEKTVICVGNEASGISDEIKNMGINKVKIPILGKAESLNVGVAGGIFMYETVRRRNFK